MPVSSHILHSKTDLEGGGNTKAWEPRKYTQTKNSFGDQPAVQKGETVAFSDPASLRSRLLLREKESTLIRPAASIIGQRERLTRKPHQLCSVQKYNPSLAGVSCDCHARGRILAAFCHHAVLITWLNRHAFEVARAFGGEENSPPVEIPFGTKISTGW